MYLKIYLSSILFGFIFLCLAVLNYQQTNSYHGPKSNHFDGTHFFNMPPYHQHSMADTIHWFLTAHRSKWPALIVNNAIPDLTPVVGDQVKVTYVNHSTMLLQTASLNFLTDPIWTERASQSPGLPGITFKDLPHIEIGKEQAYTRGACIGFLQEN